MSHEHHCCDHCCHNRHPHTHPDLYDELINARDWERLDSEFTAYQDVGRTVILYKMQKRAIDLEAEMLKALHDLEAERK